MLTIEHTLQRIIELRDQCADTTVLEMVIQRMIDHDVPMPYLYYAEEKILAEWTRNNWEISLELNNNECWCYVFNLAFDDCDSDLEMTFDINDSAAYTTLKKRLKSYEVETSME